MQITVEQQTGRVPVTVFHVKGNIDTQTYEQLQAQAQQAIEAGTRNLLLDLTEVPYVSSYGIRAISQIFTWLRNAAQDESDAMVSKGLRDGTFKSPHLKLLNPTPQVLNVLTTAGIDMFLEIVHGDPKKAIATF